MMARCFRKVFGSILRLVRRSVFTNEMREYATYEIGDGTYGRPEILAWGDGTRLVIGKYCSIADDTKILLGGEHQLDWVTTYPFSSFMKEAREIKGHPRSKGHVIIGNDVWIGNGSTILSGVAIGNGAVIGAGSVVTKSVDPYAIVAGNPARTIRYRFSADIIEQLNSIAWWNWPKDQISAAVNFLMSDNVQGLIEYHKSCEKSSWKA